MYSKRLLAKAAQAWHHVESSPREIIGIVHPPQLVSPERWYRYLYRALALGDFDFKDQQIKYFLMSASTHHDVDVIDATIRYLRRHPDTFENDDAFSPNLFQLLCEVINRTYAPELFTDYMEGQVAACERQVFRLIHTHKLHAMAIPKFRSEAMRAALHLEVAIYMPGWADQRESLVRNYWSLAGLDAESSYVDFKSAVDTHRNQLLREYWLPTQISEEEWVEAKDLSWELLANLYMIQITFASMTYIDNLEKAARTDPAARDLLGAPHCLRLINQQPAKVSV